MTRGMGWLRSAARIAGMVLLAVGTVYAWWWLPGEVGPGWMRRHAVCNAARSTWVFRVLGCYPGG